MRQILVYFQSLGANLIWVQRKKTKRISLLYKQRFKLAIAFALHRHLIDRLSTYQFNGSIVVCNYSSNVTELSEWKICNERDMGSESLFSVWTRDPISVPSNQFGLHNHRLREECNYCWLRAISIWICT